MLLFSKVPTRCGIAKPVTDLCHHRDWCGAKCLKEKRKWKWKCNRCTEINDRYLLYLESLIYSIVQLVFLSLSFYSFKTIWNQGLYIWVMFSVYLKYTRHIAWKTYFDEYFLHEQKSTRILLFWRKKIFLTYNLEKPRKKAHPAYTGNLISAPKVALDSQSLPQKN